MITVPHGIAIHWNNCLVDVVGKWAKFWFSCLHNHHIIAGGKHHTLLDIYKSGDITFQFDTAVWHTRKVYYVNGQTDKKWGWMCRGHVPRGSSLLMCRYSGNSGVRCHDQTVGIGGGYRRCRTGRDHGGEAAVVVVITGGWQYRKVVVCTGKV